MVLQESMEQQGMWRMITCVTSFVLRVQTFRYPGMCQRSRICSHIDIRHVLHHMDLGCS